MGRAVCHYALLAGFILLIKAVDIAAADELPEPFPVLLLNASDPSSVPSLVATAGPALWRDLSGNGNDMQVFNAAYDTGFGGAVNFTAPQPGMAQLGTYGVRNNLLGVPAGAWGQNFSALVWFRSQAPTVPVSVSSSSSSTFLVQVLGSSTAGDTLQPSASWREDGFSDQDADTAPGFTATISPRTTPTGCWEHLAVVKDGDGLQFYRNTKPAGSAIATNVVDDYGAAALTLGVDYSALFNSNLNTSAEAQRTFHWLSGSLSVVMVFDGALTSEAVLDVYKLDAPRFEGALCAPIIPSSPAAAPSPALGPLPGPISSPELPISPALAPSSQPTIAPAPGPSSTPPNNESPALAPSPLPTIAPAPAPSSIPSIPESPAPAPSPLPPIAPVPTPSASPVVPEAPAPAPTSLPIDPLSPSPSTGLPPSPKPQPSSPPLPSPPSNTLPPSPGAFAPSPASSLPTLPPSPVPGAPPTPSSPGSVGPLSVGGSVTLSYEVLPPNGDTTSFTQSVADVYRTNLADALLIAPEQVLLKNEWIVKATISGARPANATVTFSDFLGVNASQLQFGGLNVDSPLQPQPYTVTVRLPSATEATRVLGAFQSTAELSLRLNGQASVATSQPTLESSLEILLTGSQVSSGMYTDVIAAVNSTDELAALLVQAGMPAGTSLEMIQAPTFRPGQPGTSPVPVSPSPSLSPPQLPSPPQGAAPMPAPPSAAPSIAPALGPSPSIIPPSPGTIPTSPSPSSSTSPALPRFPTPPPSTPSPSLPGGPPPPRSPPAAPTPPSMSPSPSISSPGVSPNITVPPSPVPEPQPAPIPVVVPPKSENPTVASAQEIQDLVRVGDIETASKLIAAAPVDVVSAATALCAAGSNTDRFAEAASLAVTQQGASAAVLAGAMSQASNGTVSPEALKTGDAAEVANAVNEGIQGTIEIIAKTSSQAINSASEATAQAVAQAANNVCSGGSAEAAAEAAAQATATATAKAVASAEVTVKTTGNASGCGTATATASAVATAVARAAAQSIAQASCAALCPMAATAGANAEAIERNVATASVSVTATACSSGNATATANATAEATDTAVATAAATTYAAAFLNFEQCVAARAQPPPPPPSQLPAPPSPKQVYSPPPPPPTSSPPPPAPSPTLVPPPSPSPSTTPSGPFAIERECFASYILDECCRAGAPDQCVCLPGQADLCTYRKVSSSPLAYDIILGAQPGSACRCPA